MLSMRNMHLSYLIAGYNPGLATAPVITLILAYLVYQLLLSSPARPDIRD
jgi:hypothetical protein